MENEWDQLEEKGGNESADLAKVRKSLNELARTDGSVITMSKGQLGLLLGLARAQLENQSKDYRNVLLTADFDDVNEAKDHHAAFYEERRYFMDESDTYILDLMIMECAVNKKRHGDNRVSNILNVLRHKQDESRPAGKRGNDKVSPIEEG